MTTRRLCALTAAVVATSAFAAAPLSTATADSVAAAGQPVYAIPETVFALSVASDGATGSGSTMPVTVTREQVGGQTVVTLAPRD